MGNSLGLHC